MICEIVPRESILRLAAYERRRLRWRYLLPLMIALLTMLVCAVGMAEALWPGFRKLVGDKPNTVRARWQIWAVIYVGAALLAALAVARFHPLGALRRFPAVFVLGCAGVVVSLGVWIAGHLLAVGGSESSGGDPQSDRGGTKRVQQPVAPRNLAAALIGPRDAEDVLAAPVGPPSTSGNWLMRKGSFCRYRALDGTASLSLFVYERPSGRLGRRLAQRAAPVAGLGEEAWQLGGSLYARTGEYLLGLSASRRNGPKPDPARCLSLAKRLIAQLPSEYELADADRHLFATGWRGRFRSLLAALGLRIEQARG